MAAGVGCATACAGALGCFGAIRVGELLAYSQLASLAALVSLGLRVIWKGKRAPSLARCHAWDERGRKLRIEAI